ncbi:MAG TPA: TetR/AcrR family transcriptional regulator [Candidatus Limnocylindria bacterium]|nr:TetR/AcrR family transcriptional regulator [Candidatus Limnocylindria bacterium]
MASAAPAPIKPTSLQPLDWIRAATARLSREGIEAVRVEVLARDLRVSKGSFYWHFRDRQDLLNSLLTHWEGEETAWLHQAAASEKSAAARWATFVERSADIERCRFEAAMRGWARREDRVAIRVAAIEKGRREFIADVLHVVGFALPSADSWADLAQLVYLGWLDRSTRDAEFRLAGRGLGEFLSELVLAASAGLPSIDR